MLDHGSGPTHYSLEVVAPLGRTPQVTLRSTSHHARRVFSGGFFLFIERNATDKVNTFMNKGRLAVILL